MVEVPSEAEIKALKKRICLITIRLENNKGSFTTVI
jgi:hypothetical protein